MLIVMGLINIDRDDSASTTSTAIRHWQCRPLGWHYLMTNETQLVISNRWSCQCVVKAR